MLARESDLIELLRVKVCQREVGASLRGSAFQDLFEFLRGIQRVTGLFKGQREVVARIDGFGLEGQRDFVGGQRLFPPAKVVGSEPEIVIGIEVGGIRIDGLLVITERLVVLVGFLRSDSAGEMALRVAAVAGPGKLGRGVTVTRVTRRRRRRRK